MAALEYRILTKILKEGSLHPALVAGLKEDHFQDIESKQIWRFFNQHWYQQTTFRTVPTLEAIQRRWPSFQLVGDSREALPALIEDLRSASLELDAKRIATEFQDLVDMDTSCEAIRKMRDKINELLAEAERTEEFTLKDVVKHAAEHYAGAKSGAVYGIPWPWDCLTQDTLGKRKGNLLVFYARMKAMKTWIMLFCAVYDYLVNNCRVMIWSREMNKEDLCLRIASILAKVDYQLFKKGRLPPKKETETFKILDTLLAMEEDLDSKEMQEGAARGNRHLLILAGRNVPKDTASLQVTIDKYQPSVVYLDSFYHLEPSGASKKIQRWERLAILSECIKRMGQDNAIPIVAIHQANRLGEKTHGNTLADLADTDVLAREADLIVRILKRRGRELYEEDYEVVRDNPEPPPPAPRVFKKKGPEIAKEATEDAEKEDDAPRVGAELALVLGGNREGILEAFTINAVPGYNFSLISSDYSTQEIAQWVKEDEEPKPIKMAPRPDPNQAEKFNKNAFRQYLKSN